MKTKPAHSILSVLVMTAALVLLNGCRKSKPGPVKADFTTHEGAVLCLFEACRDGDAERVISCIDFKERARMRLKADEQTDEKLAELGRRLETQLRGDLARSFPDYTNGTATFGTTVTAELDGKPSKNHAYVRLIVTWPAKSAGFPILVAKTETGWKSIAPLNWP